MEFHAVAKVRTDAATLQNALTVPTLARVCAEFSNVIGSDDKGEADSPWGHFTVQRTLFTGGVRFQLLNCPNGLQWTLTTGFPPAPEHVFIHATVNRTEIDPDFAESLQDFVDAWRAGMEKIYPAD